ncbi:hypothetical protein [Undibacterium griseum]|uniref:TniQ protein n=1 Tax=Undibacterium griseum TaxID=2762295 RepID=A0ABR6YMI3_9BURK|nr:hypothetical protein [Undibacterium griseum]MBC3885111.1 hypothetical protein [Undibacterium griseum]
MQEGPDVHSQYSNRVIGGSSIDVSTWPTPDEGALSGDLRVLYFARKSAVTLFLQGFPAEHVKRITSLSLITRFAHLNGIKLRECESYFQHILGNTSTPSGVDIDRLATTLDEDLTTVQGVLGETINLGLGHDLSIVPEKVGDSVRYCERCASIGYHSYLHEYHWLARCPFHSTPLKIIHAPYKATTVQVRRYEALARLMQAACSYWPRTGSQSFEPKEYEGFRWLSSWAF